MKAMCIGDGTHAGPTFAMGWWQRADGLFQYQMRSVGEFDVSVLAKKHGGGGHKNAAGFESAKLLHCGF
jgi:oligoribonuclease NrnB/cAMP/cGMP phosphodiesterase (DHH superfamily)